MLAYCGRPWRHLFGDPFAYIVPAMRAKRSLKICRGAQPRQGRPRDGEHYSDRLLTMPVPMMNVRKMRMTVP